jgi:hypothetical protein
MSILNLHSLNKNPAPYKEHKQNNVNLVFAKDKVSFNPINKNWQNHY